MTSYLEDNSECCLWIMEHLCSTAINPWQDMAGQLSWRVSYNNLYFGFIISKIDPSLWE